MSGLVAYRRTDYRIADPKGPYNQNREKCREGINGCGRVAERPELRMQVPGETVQHFGPCDLAVYVRMQTSLDGCSIVLGV
jgi:hypothetical protein